MAEPRHLRPRRRPAFLPCSLGPGSVGCLVFLTEEYGRQFALPAGSRVYVYIHTYIYIYIFVCSFTHLFTYSCIYTYTCYMNTFTLQFSVYVHAYILHLCIPYVCTCTLYARAHTQACQLESFTGFTWPQSCGWHMYEYVCIYIYTYIHSHIYIHICNL